MHYLRTHDTRVVQISELKTSEITQIHLPKCPAEVLTLNLDVNFELDPISRSQDRYQLRINGKSVSYVTFLENLAKSDRFRKSFIETLNDSRFETFRIETPPGKAHILA